MPRLIRKMAMVVAGTLMVQSSLPVASVYAYETSPIKAQNKEATQSVSAKGNISTTIRFDYPIAYEKVKEQNIKVVLKKGSTNLVEIQLGADQEIIKNPQNYTVTVTPRNIENVERTTEDVIGSYAINIEGLELGEYQFTYEGDGYQTYTSKTITLKDYSKNVTVGTGDITFSYGDINGDKKVTEDDLKAIEDQIKQDQHDYDLNGDGKVDIVDLTYVKHQLGVIEEKQGEEIHTDLAAIISVDVIEAAQEALEKQGLEIAGGGSVADLFTGESQVTIQKTSGEEKLQIPLDLGEEGIEAQVIELNSPATSGGLESGTVLVEYMEDGELKYASQDFTTSVEGATLFGRSGISNTIVINLGKRVPVKRVTISVDKIVDEEGTPSYVVMEQVSFIKDIVSNVSPIDKTVVKNVKAIEKDKEVLLTWDAVPNVEGYKVICKNGSGTIVKEVNVNINSATIEGLENLKTYYFTVRATSGEWMGTASEECTATPQPSKAPLAPNFLKTEAMNGGLTLTWGKAEDATYYEVFYKESEADTAYKQFIPTNGNEKITITSATIGGLTNGVAYDLYVTAGNNIGKSKPSAIVTGTPKQIIVEGPVLPTKNRLTIEDIEDVTLTFPYNVAQEFYPNGFNTTFDPQDTKDGIKNVVDGEYGTHWTARRWWESTQINTTFKEVHEMDHVVYVPRVDGKYTDSIDTYNIVVWEEGDDLSGPGKTIVSTKKCIIRRDNKDQRYAVLTFPKTKVKKIAVSLAQWAGSPTNISASEIAFYDYYSIDDDIKALFADNTFTTLASGVTQERIDALRAQLDSKDTYYVDTTIFADELNLAEALLKQDQSQLGIMKEGLVSINTTGDTKHINDWSPLGIVGLANKQMVIYADIPDGEKVQIVPTQYYSEANSLSGTAIELTKGRNIIDIAKIGSLKETAGGSFYYRYSGSKGDQIKLHIRSINNSIVEIPTLELYDWYDLSETERKSRISKYIDDLTKYNPGKLNNKETNPVNSTEISGRNILLSLPADQVLVGLQGVGLTKEEQINKLYNNMIAWEEVIGVVHTTYGLDDPNHVLKSRQNIRYMRMFGKAFMYAAGNHIGVEYGSTSALVQGKPTSMLGNSKENDLFGWGIAHEIGHNMDRLGKAEITNNIYSLILQTYDGKDNILPSRLELSNKYEEIYKKVAIGDKGMANDVFTQLGMYWQLHLAYDGAKGDAQGPLNFYHQLFEIYDSGDVDEFDKKESGKDDKFAVAASMVANKNLTEFFTRWGADLSEAAKKEMAKYDPEERKIQYLTDESRRYRLNGGLGLESMNFTATATVVEGSNAGSEEAAGNKIKISIQADSSVSKDVLGYEIFRDGKQIAFITGTTYEDFIGSANNKVFNYQVRAIDVLGNVINQDHNEGKLDIDPIRVEHDNVIDKSQYSIQFVEKDSVTTEPAIVITFNKQTPVTGIRVKSKTDTTLPVGDFTIEVSKQTTTPASYVVAKSSNFGENVAVDANKFITYFNKPGVGAQDTRIWTYDAKTIRITGDNIDENFLKQFDVEPLSYPGDNVAFEDYKVGKLGKDYVYETEDGSEVIKAGTLIVVGSYRGDPLYNTIQIIGKYAEHSEESGEVDEITYVDRPINGEVLMFAEIPEDGETSDISDGLFIFIPDIQKEEELQGDCSHTSVLPTQIMAKMYRYDNLSNTGTPRVTSTTLWYTTPSYESMPEIILNQGVTSLIQEDMYEKN